MTTEPENQPLISEFADDEDMMEIVEEFVRELPERTAALQHLLNLQDFDEIRRLAHQMKGAAAGYGFPTLGEAAGNVEQRVDTAPATANELKIAIDELIELCQRASLG